MTNRIHICGAADGEMQAIERVLTSCGEAYTYATYAGTRVTPAAAYHADCTWQNPCPGKLWDEIIAVECMPTYATAYIDHHRLGDSGYGVPPEEFLRGSSLGQVIAELARYDVLQWPIGPLMCAVPPGRLEAHHHQGNMQDPYISFVTTSRVVPGWPDSYVTRVIPHELVLTAAADHCLGHAYAGRCPGIDPDELLRHRVAQKVAFRAPCHAGPYVSADSILADIEAARQALLSAPTLVLMEWQCPWHEGGHSRSSDDCCNALGTEYADEPCERIAVADMRGRHVPELPEAGTRYGIPYIADGLPDADGRVKIVCSGSADTIRAFFGWAAREGLTDAYGDPERGFAGAYR